MRCLYESTAEYGAALVPLINEPYQHGGATGGAEEDHAT